MDAGSTDVAELKAQLEKLEDRVAELEQLDAVRRSELRAVVEVVRAMGVMGRQVRKAVRLARQDGSALGGRVTPLRRGRRRPDPAIVLGD